VANYPVGFAGGTSTLADANNPFAEEE